MADKTNIGIIIVAFITIIVGIPLLVEVADNVFDVNNEEIVLLESSDYSAGIVAVDDGGWNTSMNVDQRFSLANDFIVTVNAVLLNGTDEFITLTEGTDFSIDKPRGTYSLLNTSSFLSGNLSFSNATIWNYTHAETYVQDGTSRTLLGLIPLFFVIGLLLMVIAIIFKDSILGLLGR